MIFPLGRRQGDMVVSPTGHLLAGRTPYRCALGAGGISHTKLEGDGATPAGQWPLRYGFYRADRVAKPVTAGLLMFPLSPRAGWCDEPAHYAYNRPIRFPFAARAEHLWRSDGLYDIVVILGYNDAPVIPQKGSAIFLHVARPFYSPTEGCVALAKGDLLAVLRVAKQGSHLIIRA